jgi:hypothetical protein
LKNSISHYQNCFDFFETAIADCIGMMSPDLAGGGGGLPLVDMSMATGADLKCGAHPMGSNAACDLCGQTNCPTQYAACFSGGQCAAYVACFCACSDSACVTNCNKMIDQTCATCVGALTACQKAACGGTCP